MGPLSEVITKVVPEQVVQHGLGDPRGPHVGDVPLLVAPLHPARLGGAGVDQHHALHPLGVGEGVAGEHVAAEPHPQPDVAHDLEVVQHLLHLLGQSQVRIVVT